MTLPAELDRKIRDRFDKLLQEIQALLDKLDEYSENHAQAYRQWIVKSCGLVTWIFGDSEEGATYTTHLERTFWQTSGMTGPGFPWKKVKRSIVADNAALLRGIQDNYVNGFYDSLEDLIVANVSADYMAQAESLLAEGVAGQFDHVPAAVLCGAVLENRLRSYCDNHQPPIPTQKANGDYKTLGPLIAELDKAKAFDKQTRNMLRSWADIRNSAAHGKFDEFTREQVELMLMGVNQFLANEL